MYACNENENEKAERARHDSSTAMPPYIYLAMTLSIISDPSNRK